ncbi:BREX-1 system adenine-specific DNA-methyltransferase PglX [Pseudomonas sp. NPDC087814]|uniref:BREX-1 system adenine-specific DNA-methyltransferase PglX n=1 Tax=Pseudomonas sp. NPDC087814 TaxID=3364450 RepID=UPI0038200B4A
MNRTALKKYAPQARLDFVDAVTLRARRLGLDPSLPVLVERTGDVLLIAGQPFSASIAEQRTALVRRIHREGFGVVVEALAYTWFNRFVAIRFMELKGYFSHGYRVLSHPQGQQPEILDNVQHLELPGLNKDEIIRLKTAGNQDEALYREILLAQCHELHRNMPFLFEALDDATELLLPDNLLRTDSPIARLVSDIEEGDWKEVEIIGWLYQFYISEKKSEVMGKVVRSEDIPAATQLFTPNWIVQYLVQNSLGRLWLMANPGSKLQEKMNFYIDSVEQAPGVKEQLDALIKVRMNEDGGILNPESLRILDPACGSGHILVEAYNLLRSIYEERGYRLRDIPRLIIKNNLFGLDIDDRAAQLAGFAILMKAREDDRRLFDDESNPPQLNVMAIQQSEDLADEDIAQAIMTAGVQIEGGDAFQSGQLFGGGQLATQHSSGLSVHDLRELIQLFLHGKSFGSLITVPSALNAKLEKIIDLLTTVRSLGDDLSRHYASQILEQFARPAMLLAMHCDAVIANPPYMGSKGMNKTVKEFASAKFKDSKSDMFAMFIERGFGWCKLSGFNSMVTMQAWMFQSSYQDMRENLLSNCTIHTMAHLGARAFAEISGEVVQTSAFVLQKGHVSGFKPVFFRLVDGVEDEKKSALLAGANRHEDVVQDEFSMIPGSPIAYWITDEVLKPFAEGAPLGEIAAFRAGLSTGDNARFQRYWYEVDSENIQFNCSRKSDATGARWYPCNSGGLYRKWYGNNEFVVDWEDDGVRIKSHKGSAVRNSDTFFRSGLTYSKLSTGRFAARFKGVGFIYDDTGRSVFCEKKEDVMVVLGLLCSEVAHAYLAIMAPTMSFTSAELARIPVLDFDRSLIIGNVERLVSIAKEDWDSQELSWDFLDFPLVKLPDVCLSSAWASRKTYLSAAVEAARELEEQNNQHFIDAYSLQGQLLAEVPDSKITLYRADREKDMQCLLSYVIGCMMGRYSLDEPGVIYARNSSSGFLLSRYKKFPADTDGIIPITEEPWFEDDVAHRVREFVKVVWGADTLVKNMEWLADSLGRKAGESAYEAIRRYLSTSFYKDHLQTYKKRPIYWLFSSGKQKAFECLVYLHRYNEGTLSRMRMEYVVPLQSRMQARIDKLADDINSAIGSAQQKALQKRKDKLTKQLEELRRFDETLRPYADQRIVLNLDDGVKVNYGKFGDLLAEVKAITGGKED